MVRKLRRVLLILALGGVSLLILAVIALPLGGDRMLLNSVLSSVMPGLTISVADVAGNYVSHLEVRGLRLVRRDGVVLLRCDTVRVSYDLKQLLSGKVQVHRLDLVAPWLTLPQAETGSWNPLPRSAPKGASSPRKAKSPPPVTIERFAISRGTADFSPSRAQREVRVRFDAAGSLLDWTLAVDRLALQSDSSRVAASGALRLPRSGGKLQPSDLNLAVEAAPLTAAELRTFVPKLHVKGGGVTFKGRFLGSDTSPAVALDARFQKLDLASALGQGFPVQTVEGSVFAELAGEQFNRMNGTVRAKLSDGSRSLQVSSRFKEGEAEVDLRGNLIRAVARINGWIRPFDSVPSYDLRATWQPRGGKTPQSDRWLNPWRRIIAVSARGRGMPPQQAIGRGSVRIAPVEQGVALLDSARVDFHLDGSAGRFATHAAISGGIVTLNGRATWGSTPWVWIQQATIKDLELAPLLSDSGWSKLNGRFSLGLVPRPENLRVELQSHLNTAEIGLSASGSISGKRRTLNIRQLTFRDLDLSRFRPRESSTDLNGSVQLSAAGSTLRSATVSASALVTESRVGRRELHRARVEGGLHKGVIQAAGELAAPAGQLSFSGHARPFDSIPSYRLQRVDFTDLDLGQVLGKSSLHSSLTGSLSSEGKGARLKDASLSSKLVLANSRVGPVALSRGRIDGKLEGGEVEVLGQLRGRRDSVLIGAAVSPFDPQPKIRLATRLPFAELVALLRPDSTPAAEGAAYLVISGELGRTDSMRLQAELQADGNVPGLTLDSLGAKLRLSHGVIRLDSLTLRSSVADASGSGRIGMFGTARSSPAHLRFTARLGSLAPLSPYLGSAMVGLDSGTVTATAEGTRDRLQVALGVEASGLSQGKQRVEHLSVAGHAHLAGDSLSSGQAELSARGIRSGKRVFQSVLAQGNYRERQLGVRGEVLVDARHEARIVAGARFAGEETDLQLDTLNLRFEPRRWALIHPVAVSYGERLQVNDLVLAAGPHRISVNGVIDPSGEQAFRVRIDSLPLEGFSQLLGLGELEGQLNSSADLVGPGARPRLTAQWDISARARRRAVGRSHANLEWNSEGLTLVASVHPPEGDSLRIDGRVPLALSLAPTDPRERRVTRIPGGQLEVDVVGQNVAIEKFQPLFNPEKLSDLRGQLSLDAHARGSLEAPRLSGDIVIRDAQVRIAPLAKYHHGSLQLRLEGNQAHVVQGRFRSGKGRADLSGRLGFGAFPQLVLNVHAKVRQFEAISDGEVRARITGDVNLGGDVKTPRLGGNVQLDNSDYYLQAKTLQSSAEPVTLSPEDVKILEQRFGPEVAGRSKKLKGFMPPWGLDARLALGKNVWLRRRSDPVLAVELSGDLEVKKQPGGELQVYGQIQPMVGRSFMQLMSRRFDLKSGKVALNGPLRQARLGLDAEYRTTEAGGSTPVVILATVKSDTGSLDVKLDSRPVMREADILSYLTTGRPASTDPTLQSDEQGVLTAGASLAVGAALGSVAGKAGQQLGLDVVQVLQDRQGGQTVVAGKYVSPPLYLGFRQPIVPASNTNRSTNDQPNAVELELEYAALRDMLLNLQAGGSEMRVFLKLRR